MLNAREHILTLSLPRSGKNMNSRRCQPTDNWSRISSALAGPANFRFPNRRFYLRLFTFGLCRGQDMVLFGLMLDVF